MPTDHPPVPVALTMPYPRAIALATGFALTLAALMFVQFMSGSPPPL